MTRYIIQITGQHPEQQGKSRSKYSEFTLQDDAFKNLDSIKKEVRNAGYMPVRETEDGFYYEAGDYYNGVHVVENYLRMDT